MPRPRYKLRLALLFSLVWMGQCAPLADRAWHPQGLPSAASFEQMEIHSARTRYLWHSSSIVARLFKGGTVSLEFPDRTRVRISFPGANAASEPQGECISPRKTIYYVGPSSDWRAHPHFERVRYREMYPGIDVVFITNSGQLEYNFEVAPHADPTSIHIRYDGASVGSIRDGSLMIRAAGNITQPRPLAFQKDHGRTRMVACDYHVQNRHEVTLLPRDYNPDVALVIDPVLNFSTYVGGATFDVINALARDASGNLYMTGETNSSSLWNSATSGRASHDAFIAKLDRAASRVLYTIYLGGSGEDSGTGIAVDASGNAYVTGVTGSTNFPVTSGAFATNLSGPKSAFVAKLGANGNLLYSTYMGGTSSDFGAGIAIDSAGAAYIAGQAESSNFPVTAGAFQTTHRGGISDCFVSKLNAAGTALVYSTFLGGSALDSCAAVAVDESGNASVTGTTYSSDFPTQLPFQANMGGNANAFLAKLNPSGTALVYSTFVGGSGTDNGNAIALDTSGAAYIAGDTSSNDFPVTSGAVQTTLNGNFNAFVSKFSANGSTLIYSTFMGGSKADRVTSMALDQSGRAVLGGYTDSSDFPTTSALQSQFQGVFNAFAAVLAPDGSSLVFSSYFGGSGDDRAYAVTVGAANELYEAGATSSNNFPTTSAIQPALNGSYDGFVLEANYATSAPVPAAMSSPSPGPTLSGASATFQWNAGSGVSHYWLYVSKISAGRNDLFDSGSINHFL